MGVMKFNNVKITSNIVIPELRSPLSSGDTIGVLFGKTQKYFDDMKAVAFTGSYNDLTDTPEIFDGDANTAKKLYTARNITIGNKTNVFDGSANVKYTLKDIGAISPKEVDKKISNAAYNLPVASSTTLGGVKIADPRITIDENGIISVIDPLDLPLRLQYNQLYYKISCDRANKTKIDLYNYIPDSSDTWAINNRNNYHYKYAIIICSEYPDVDLDSSKTSVSHEMNYQQFIHIGFTSNFIGRIDNGSPDKGSYSEVGYTMRPGQKLVVQIDNSAHKEIYAYGSGTIIIIYTDYNEFVELFPPKNQRNAINDANEWNALIDKYYRKYGSDGYVSTYLFSFYTREKVENNCTSWVVSRVVYNTYPNGSFSLIFSDDNNIVQAHAYKIVAADSAIFSEFEGCNADGKCYESIHSTAPKGDALNKFNEIYASITKSTSASSSAASTAAAALTAEEEAMIASLEPVEV